MHPHPHSSHRFQLNQKKLFDNLIIIFFSEFPLIYLSLGVFGRVNGFGVSAVSPSTQTLFHLEHRFLSRQHADLDQRP